MPQKRRTLGDRNRASIALDPTPELEPTAEPRSSAQPNPAPTPVKAPQKSRTATDTGSTPRTGAARLTTRPYMLQAIVASVPGTISTKFG